LQIHKKTTPIQTITNAPIHIGSNKSSQVIDFFNGDATIADGTCLHSVKLFINLRPHTQIIARSGRAGITPKKGVNRIIVGEQIKEIECFLPIVDQNLPARTNWAELPAQPRLVFQQPAN